MIDMHLHAVPPGLPGAGPLSPLLERPADEVAATIREQMAQAGLSAVLAMGRLDAGDDALGIESTLRIAEMVPHLHAIGAMDPRRADAGHLSRVEEQLPRVKALKGYLGYLHFGPDHPGYRPYYELAARHRVPVIFHTGDCWSPRAKLRFAHPLLVDEVAVDHPGVDFVMAHVGNPWMLDAAEVVYKNLNVWCDLSGLAVGDEPGDDETLARLAAAWRYAERPNRFVFGSDWPLAPVRAYRDWVIKAIPEECREDVLDLNARRLFRL
ncbi:MAG: amidohydrolase family protein [Gemmataceae bacterium]|nr:amidohydrolase family protein [Gemmataceae bacterium]